MLKLLALKFGKLSAEARKTVRDASMQEPDNFAVRILTANTLATVFKPAKKR